MSRWLGILFLFTALSAKAESAGDALTAKEIAECTAAYQAWDGSRFAGAADRFRQASDHLAKEGLSRVMAKR